MKLTKIVVRGLFAVLFLSVFPIFSKAYAQAPSSDCVLSGGETWTISATVVDQTGARWGKYPAQDAASCSPGVLTTADIVKNTSVGTNYVKQVRFYCNDDPTIRAFRIDEYASCHGSAPDGPMSVVLNPPPGYECTTWNYTNPGGSGASATGCTANFTMPRTEQDARLVMGIAPVLSCPSSFGVPVCNAAGSQATLSWSGVSGATEYGLRVDGSPPSWGTYPPDAWWNGSSTSTTVNITANTLYSWSVEPRRIAGLVNFANQCQANRNFTCSFNTPTPTRTPTPTSTPTRTPTPTPTRTPTPTPTPIYDAACTNVTVSPVSPFSTILSGGNLNVNLTVNDNTAACVLSFSDTLAGLNNAGMRSDVSFDFAITNSCSLSGNVSPGYVNRNVWYRARASGITGDYNCVTGMFCADNAPPPVPVPTISFDPFDKVVVEWNSVSEVGCGLDSSPYWAQLSEFSSFVTIWPTSWPAWFNSWQSTTSQTSSAACTPGKTYYAHVRSRDATNNQSAWSSTVSIVCPAVSTPTPTPTPILPPCTVLAPIVDMSCRQVGTSTTQFNVTTAWTPQSSAGGCTPQQQTFTASLSANDSPYLPLDPVTKTAPDPNNHEFTNGGTGYFANFADAPDIYGRVVATDGLTSNESTTSLNLGCSTFPLGDFRRGECDCDAAPPPPVNSMLRYCPEPPAI